MTVHKKMLKRFTTGILLILCAAVLAGCGGAGDKTYSPTEKNVKLLGRTFMHDDILWASYTASGIEFKYEKATKVEIALVGDYTSGKSGQKSNYPKYSVFVNDVEYEMGMLSEKEKIISIDVDKSETGVIRVNKVSESANSTMGIKSVTTDGKIRPAAKKKLNIQFIGDSITCGYGVEGAMGDSFSTSNENGLKTYAYKAAQKLDADYTMVSYSGYGVVSGYTTSGKANTASLLPKYYDKLGNSGAAINGGTKVNTFTWDFSKDKFDFVVINLGTNDNSYVAGKADRKTEFENGYVSFLKTIREKNPKAYIICSLGMMGQDLYGSIEKAVSVYSAETGDKNVGCLKFDVQDANKDGVAVDWHPTEATHEKASQKLVDYINNVKK